MIALLFMTLAWMQQGPANPPQDLPPQGPAPHAQQGPEQWWSNLPPHEREELRRRMEQFRQMDPQQRQRLEQRRKVFEEEKKRLLNSMSSEEQARYQAMSSEEQQRYLRRKVMDSLRTRGESLQRRFPQAGRNRESFLQARQEQVRQGLEKAYAEGWIGKKTADWLQHAPFEEAMGVLMEVQKWQFLDYAARRDFWGESGIDPEQQRRLKGLPAPEFFRQVRAMGGRSFGNFPGPHEGRPPRGEVGPPNQGRAGSRPWHPGPGARRGTPPPREEEQSPR